MNRHGLERPVTVGRIAGLFGIRGWVKVISYTEPRDNLIGYDPWLIDLDGTMREFHVTDGKLHGKALIVQLAGIDERDAASRLVGLDITVRREQLPALSQGEYYWADLVGLTVVNQDGVTLGTVDRLIETGANDVLVIAGREEQLVPFVQGDVVTEVDLAGGCIRVAWEPEPQPGVD